MSIHRSRKMVGETQQQSAVAMNSLLVQSEALNSVHNNMSELSMRLGQAGQELTVINKKVNGGCQGFLFSVCEFLIFLFCFVLFYE
jgi:hypothetical protein